MIKNTTTHHDSSDSRARLPILIAVLMLLVFGQSGIVS